MWRPADPPARYPLTRHLICNRLLLRRPFSFETSVSRERTCKEGRIVKFACGTGTNSTGTRGGERSSRLKTTVQSRKPGRLFQSKTIPVLRCCEPPFNENTSVPELWKPAHSSGCKAFPYRLVRNHCVPNVTTVVPNMYRLGDAGLVELRDATIVGTHAVLQQSQIYNGPP